MFHTLRKIVIRLFALCVSGLVVGVGAFVYEKRAIFDPVADFIEVLKLPAGSKSLEQVSGQAIKVMDDYSFQLKDDRGQLFSFRLVGLAPLPPQNAANKTATDFRQETESALRGLVLSNQVRVAVTFLNERRTGLGIAYVGETNVNAAMVEAGLGKVKREFLNGLPRQEQFALVRAESKAREKKAGLWKEPADSN